MVSDLFIFLIFRAWTCIGIFEGILVSLFTDLCCIDAQGYVFEMFHVSVCVVWGFGADFFFLNSELFPVYFCCSGCYSPISLPFLTMTAPGLCDHIRSFWFFYSVLIWTGTLYSTHCVIFGISYIILCIWCHHVWNELKSPSIFVLQLPYFSPLRKPGIFIVH